MTQAVRIMFSHFHPQRKASAASDFLQLFSFGFYLIGQKYGGNLHAHWNSTVCICVCICMGSSHAYMHTNTHTYRRTKMVVKKRTGHKFGQRRQAIITLCMKLASLCSHSLQPITWTREDWEKICLPSLCWVVPALNTILFIMHWKSFNEKMKKLAPH